MITRPWFLASAIAILLIALFLRVGQLSSENLGGDEMYSIHSALGDTSLGADLGRQDMQPPLFHLLLGLTLPRTHPASEISLRWLSLAAGIALIVLTLGIGLMVPLLRVPALLATILLTLNKAHIFYSQELRPYALFSLLVGGLLLWALLLDRYGDRWSYWLAGTALMTAILYTHFFGSFYCGAVLIPMVFGKSSWRTRLYALASGAVAGALFVPCLMQKMDVLRASNVSMSAEATGQGVANWFSLKMLFAGFVGIPDFSGATTLAFAIGAVLVCCAVLPRFRKESAILNIQSRITLITATLLPAIVAFLLARSSLHLAIFSDRHVLPSIVPALILVSYGLWRLALLTPKPMVSMVLGGMMLCALQALPVWSNWPGPARQPRAQFADWLRTHDLNYPVYTTWPYGIGEPVMFYLAGSRPIYMLPGTPPMVMDMTYYLQASLRGYRFPPPPAGLPDKFIVLYRPAAAKENTTVQALLDRFEMTEEKQCYSARNSEWGTCLLVLRRRDFASRN
jgi:hypothetical protein